MRWNHIILAITVTACTTDSNVEVEQTVSGLRPGGVPGVPGTGSSIMPKKPGEGQMRPTDIALGDYAVEIVTVREADPDRTDIYEGAQWKAEVTSSIAGYQIDDWVHVAGMDGRLDGRGFEQERDEYYDCGLQAATRVRGFVRDNGGIRLVVEEQVFVAGKECEKSELGPSRFEENVYRVEMMPVE